MIKSQRNKFDLDSEIILKRLESRNKNLDIMKDK